MPPPSPSRVPGMRLGLGRRIVLRLADLLRGSQEWHEQKTYLGLLSLLAIRIRLRYHNLVDTSLIADAETEHGSRLVEDRDKTARSADGQHVDPAWERMGAAGTRFGRNAPLWGQTKGDPADLLEPSPREVSRRLLAPLSAHTPWLDELRAVHARSGSSKDFDAEYLGRRPAGIINLLSAAWIQFMVHDWVSHGTNRREDPIEVPLADDDDWHEDPMRIRRTPSDKTNTEPGGPPTFINTETHWWDGSQIYGSTPARLAVLRKGMPDGKLRIDAATKLLELEDDDDNPRTGKVDLTGVNGNWWLGLSLLHGLFTLEHNHLCDVLKKEYGLGDEETFDKARLINAAVMAKIHTIEWTPAILPHRILDTAMHGNWSGLFGPRAARALRRLGVRSDLLIGIPGSRQDHHGAAYTLTEEFVSVYRLHALLPDEVTLRRNGERVDYTMAEVSGGDTRAVLERHDLVDLWRSFGTEPAFGVRLHNFPESLRDLRKPDETDDDRRIDLAAIDVLRDRERGVPRYAAFREMLRMPVPATFLIERGGPPGITDDPVWAHELEQLYGTPDKVDLMVGLYAEPLPKGFGFSETALHIFALMASRRLKSDRFFTDDYNAEVYTELGMRWIEESSMASVLRRHFRELAPDLSRVANPFAPWEGA